MTKLGHFVCQNMKHVAQQLFVLLKFKKKTSKQENAKNLAITHGCKFEVQMLISSKTYDFLVYHVKNI